MVVQLLIKLIRVCVSNGVDILFSVTTSSSLLLVLLLVVFFSLYEQRLTIHAPTINNAPTMPTGSSCSPTSNHANRQAQNGSVEMSKVVSDADIVFMAAASRYAEKAVVMIPDHKSATTI